MAGTYGVNNLLKVLDLGIELGNVAGKSLEDGKIGLTDMTLATSLFDEVMGLTSVNWSDLPKEAKELDHEDMAIVSQAFAAKFDIPQDELETKVEAAIVLAMSAIKFASEVKDFVSSLKKKEVIA